MTGFVALGNAPLKEVQLFQEIVPSLHRMLVLVDPDDPGVLAVQACSAAGRLRVEDHDSWSAARERRRNWNRSSSH